MGKKNKHRNRSDFNRYESPIVAETKQVVQNQRIDNPVTNIKEEGNYKYAAPDNDDGRPLNQSIKEKIDPDAAVFGSSELPSFVRRKIEYKDGIELYLSNKNKVCVFQSEKGYHVQVTRVLPEGITFAEFNPVQFDFVEKGKSSIGQFTVDFGVDEILAIGIALNEYRRIKRSKKTANIEATETK